MAFMTFRGKQRFSRNIGYSEEVVRLKDMVISKPPLQLLVPVVPTLSCTASTGDYTFAGTCAMALGSAGTSTLIGHGLGTGREIYFCSTAGTTQAIPLGPTAFTHYYVSTSGYSDDTFTVGTSASGTAGTQINFTGTAGTHMLWSKNP